MNGKINTNEGKFLDKSEQKCAGKKNCYLRILFFAFKPYGKDHSYLKASIGLSLDAFIAG